MPGSVVAPGSPVVAPGSPAVVVELDGPGSPVAVDGPSVAPVVDGGFPERVGFPYVLLQRDQDAPCRNFWEYGGPDAISASGCIDPRGKRVEAQVEVEVDGTRYLIRARSLPPNLTP